MPWSSRWNVCWVTSGCREALIRGNSPFWGYLVLSPGVSLLKQNPLESRMFMCTFTPQYLQHQIAARTSMFLWADHTGRLLPDFRNAATRFSVLTFTARSLARCPRVLVSSDWASGSCRHRGERCPREKPERSAAPSSICWHHHVPLRLVATESLGWGTLHGPSL